MYGWNACQAVFEHRPEAILRAFFSRARSSQVGSLKRWCAAHKLPFRELDEDSLNQVAASVHHEGVVMVVRPRAPQPAFGLVRKGLPADGLVMALDRVTNPHNFGAILRCCGFFDVAGLVTSSEGGAALPTPSAARMAEGALETVPIYLAADLASTLRDFHERRVFVLGADLAAEPSLYDTRVRFPCVAVLGNEQEGLSDRVQARCDAVVKIPGGGALQSLNVGVAAGIVLAELRRRLAAGETGG